MTVDLKGLIGKARRAHAERTGVCGWLLSCAHALRHRDRALPDEAAGRHRSDFAAS